MRFSEAEQGQRSTEQIQLRTTRQEKVRWVEMAHHRGMTLTEIIRHAMREEEARWQE